MKPDLKPTGRVAGMLFLAQGLIAIPVYTSAGLMGSITTSRFLTAAAVRNYRGRRQLGRANCLRPQAPDPCPPLRSGNAVRSP